MVFVFHFVVDYIYQFLYVELSLHLWDEGYLITEDDLFDVFLDLVCKYFVEYFCIYVYKGNWSLILFLSGVFLGFWYWSSCGLIKRTGHYFFCFLFCGIT